MPLLALCLLAPGAAWAEIGDEIRDDLASAQIVADAGAGEPLRLAPTLAGFYAMRADAPGWVNDQGPLPRALEMLDVVRRSGEDGLNPEDYHLHALESLFSSMRVSFLPTASRRWRLAAIELLLSDAFLLLGEHESRGRIDPLEMDPMITADSRDEDLDSDLQTVMMGAAPRTVLQGLAPQSADYAALQDVLARYQRLQAEGPLPPITDGPPLQDGDAGPRVAALIAHLVSEGDLRQAPQQADRFGPEVLVALKHYQERHGVDGDGFAGTVTLELLNQPPRAIIDRIRVNLERRRWLTRDPPATHVEVNIADFRATLYKDGKPVLSAPTVVGQPYRQTPEFSDRIRYLVVNPRWDVPPIIAGEDILPKVQQDPGYLAKHGYQVLQGWNAAEHLVDARSIDWGRWTAETLPYRFRQLPGPENALGQVKFMFPNRFGVYLHDTPAKGLFAAQTRTFSSGCIRVAHALDLAVELLRLDGQADPEALIHQALASGETREIVLARPLPIDIVYLTAWVDDLGVVQFRPDVYGRDSEILHALDAPLAISHP